MSNTALVIKQAGGATQFQRIFSDMYEVKVQTTPGAITTGIDVLETVTVPGLALGDMCIGISSSADLASITLTAYVSAANTLVICFANNTAGTITPTASATIKAIVMRPNF